MSSLVEWMNFSKALKQIEKFAGINSRLRVVYYVPYSLLAVYLLSTLDKDTPNCWWKNRNKTTVPLADLPHLNDSCERLVPFFLSRGGLLLIMLITHVISWSGKIGWYFFAQGKRKVYKSFMIISPEEMKFVFSHLEKISERSVDRKTRYYEHFGDVRLTDWAEWDKIVKKTVSADDRSNLEKNQNYLLFIRDVIVDSNSRSSTFRDVYRSEMLLSMIVWFFMAVLSCILAIVYGDNSIECTSNVLAELKEHYGEGAVFHCSIPYVSTRHNLLWSFFVFTLLELITCAYNLDRIIKLSNNCLNEIIDDNPAFLESRRDIEFLCRVCRTECYPNRPLLEDSPPITPEDTMVPKTIDFAPSNGTGASGSADSGRHTGRQDSLTPTHRASQAHDDNDSPVETTALTV